MAGAPPKAKRSPVPPQRKPPARPATLNVHPGWILSALAGVMLFGLVCAYATLAIVFYYSQWQLVLHPSRTVDRTPAAAGLAFQDVRFGVDASGQPQLDGWWIPSQLPTDPTVLLLHDGSGSLSSTLPDIGLLHHARLNVFAFDYRGFGQSGGRHPSEATMTADARSALLYLQDTRGIPPAFLVVYGRGLGGSLATLLCAENPKLAALILDSPEGDTLTRIATQDARARILPMKLIFHERFPLADPLHTLKTPKLLISWTAGNPPLDLQRAADPKWTVEIPSHTETPELHSTLLRFLNTYVLRVPAELKPNPS